MRAFSIKRLLSSLFRSPSGIPVQPLKDVHIIENFIFESVGDPQVVCAVSTAGTPSSKRSILIFHDIQSPVDALRDLMLRLASEGYYVVAPDLRRFNQDAGARRCNHGPRTVSNVLSIVEGLLGDMGQTAFTCVAGQGAGALLARVCASKRKDLFEHLVLLNQPLIPPLRPTNRGRENINECQDSASTSNEHLAPHRFSLTFHHNNSPLELLSRTIRLPSSWADQQTVHRRRIQDHIASFTKLHRSNPEVSTHWSRDMQYVHSGNSESRLTGWPENYMIPDERVLEWVNESSMRCRPEAYTNRQTLRNVSERDVERRVRHRLTSFIDEFPSSNNIALLDDLRTYEVQPVRVPTLLIRCGYNWRGCNHEDENETMSHIYVNGLEKCDVENAAYCSLQDIYATVAFKIHWYLVGQLGHTSSRTSSLCATTGSED